MSEIDPASCSRVEREYLRLTPHQADIFFDQQVYQGIPLYNIGGYVVLREAVDVQAFTRAFENEIARHDAFDLRIERMAAGVVQSLHRQRHELTLHDFSMEPDARDSALRWLKAAFQRAFQLTHEPLHFSGLMKIGEHEFWYYSIAHHLIIDGWGYGVWVRRLVERYLEETGRRERSSESGITYLDCVRARIEGEKHLSPARSAEYWKRILARWPGPLLDRRRPALADRAVRSHRFVQELPQARQMELRRFAAEHGAQWHHLLIAALYIYFSTVRDQRALMIGVPSHNRRGAEKHVVGSFVGISPCLIEAQDDADFISLLTVLKRAMTEVVRHHGTSLGEIVRLAARLGQTPGRVFDLQFNYLKLDYETCHSGLSTQTRYLANDWAQPPLSLNVCEFGASQAIEIQIDVNEAYFSAREAQLLLDRLDFLIDQAMANPHRAIAALDVVPPAEKRLLLRYAGRGTATTEVELDLADTFQRIARLYPDHIAVRSLRGESECADLSYAELDRRAGVLAARITRSSSQSAREQKLPIAICMARGEGLIIVMLAALKLRRPYLPLDITYPLQRLQFIVGDSKAEIVVTDQAGDGIAASLGISRMRVEEERASTDSPGFPESLGLPRTWNELRNDVACILYTSGSTGAPKGVVVSHAGILRLVRSPNFMPLDTQTVMLQLCSVLFDVSTFEVFGPLLNGGTVALYPPVPPDFAMFTRVLEQLGVTAMWLTAGLFEQWAARSARIPAALRYVLAGGDVVSPSATHKLLQRRPDLVFINGYGPTENTTFSACWVSDGNIDSAAPLPIGKPIQGSTAYVVDAHGRLAPFGEEGELWVGGLGVAIGYLNRPDLAAAKFVTDPLQDMEGRVYRTGDRARWSETGELEFFGRLDDQVKIRGFRIETGEIETHLQTHPHVREAVVVVNGSSAAEKYLSAHVCASCDVDPEQLTSELMRFLRERLPEYMIPSLISVRDELPLNASGKVDRSRLRRETAPSMPDVEGGSAAQGLTEEIRRAWQIALRRPVVSFDRNFFECGGHSLAAMEILAEIGERFGVELTVADFLKEGTVRRQAELVQRLLERRQIERRESRAFRKRAESAAGDFLQEEHERRPLSAPVQTRRVPLSLMQESLWTAHRLGGGSHQYNLPGVFRLHGPLDVHALEAALKALINRHAPLTSVVIEDRGEPCSVLRDASLFEMQVENALTLTETQQREKIAHLARQERTRSFDLCRELPIRARLLRCGESVHVLFLTIHHMAIDGLSLKILFTELARLYQAACASTDADLPPLEFEYAEFAIRERERVAAETDSVSQDYWRHYLLDAPLQHKLPLDRPRPESPSYFGRVLRSEIDSGATARLRAQAATNGVSLFSLLSTALALVVGEQGQERDVVVGTPVNTRTSLASYRSIGCFVNTLVLRTRYAGTESWLEVARRCHQEWLENLRHAQLPYRSILAAAQPPQTRSFNPLFQIWIALHSQSGDTLLLPGLETQRILEDEANTKVDLMLSITENGDVLSIEWLYAEELFDRRTMQSLLDAYCRLLRNIDELADVPSKTLSGLLGPASEEIATPMQTLYEANESIAERIFHHALRTPAAAALVSAEGRLSYAQLASKVRRLKSLLVESGVRPGARVAICADRRIGGVIALAAVQALGAAYVPIDSSLPAERLNFILADAGITMLLATSSAMERLAVIGLDVILVDDVLDDDWLAEYSQDDSTSAAGSAHSTACVIYTSGSTGTPKGVAVSRRNIAHYIAALRERHDFSGCRQFAVSSAFHTDLGNTTLYVGLWCGACLHLMDTAMMLDGRAVSDYVRTHEIDVIKITPGHFAALCDGTAYPPPVPRKLLIFGGEVLGKELLLQIRGHCVQRDCRVINHYGPTEATIGCVTCQLDLQQLADTAPLGLPLPGECARIVLDDVAVPRGAWGELWIGGPAVTQGYLNREDLTARQFVTHTTSTGGVERYYRTGDQARIGADGHILFGGRLDDQVKIRGFRIEPAEIDAHLQSMPGVTAAVTLVHQESPSLQSLVSFVTPADVHVAELLERLRRKLPDYMIPSAITSLDSLPRLGNGKIDRRSLAQFAERRGASTLSKPKTQTEDHVHSVVRELLGRASVPVNLGFFDAGGNSLLVARLANELQRKLDIHLPVTRLMENPSIEDVAALIDDLRAVIHKAAPAGEAVELEI